ncbi:MAG: class I SAM-dependent methyltransferase [Coprothermobacterota bacterium]|nr:class I SAM-dependent methyltransferase [Coprothermobacterota bacterium]
MFDFASDPYRILSAVYDSFHLSRFSLAAAQVVLEALSSIKPGAMLDLGCGTGQAVFHFARAGWKAMGIDNCPQMLSLARLNALEAQAPTEFTRGDMRELPGGLKVDLVTCFAALNHNSPADLGKFPAKAAQVLRPGGHVAFDLLTPEGAAALPASEAQAEGEQYLLRLRILSPQPAQLSTRLVWFKGKSGHFEKQECLVVEHPLSLAAAEQALKNCGFKLVQRWGVEGDRLVPAAAGSGRLLILATRGKV